MLVEKEIENITKDSKNFPGEVRCYPNHKNYFAFQQCHVTFATQPACR
jgi:hypothetical protein